MDIKEL